jgi:hypothetical protein
MSQSTFLEKGASGPSTLSTFPGLCFLQVPKVYLASLARMAPAGFLAHLGHSVILVFLDCKALQDLKVW